MSTLNGTRIGKLCRALAGVGVLVGVLLAGCGGSDGDDAPAVPAAEPGVPASAAVSSMAYIAYLKALVAMADDSSEPLEVKITAPLDDDSEPDPGV